MDEFSEKDVARFLAFMRKQQASSPVVTNTAVTSSSKPDIKATPHQTDSDDEENFNLKNDFVIAEPVLVIGTTRCIFFNSERLHSLTSRGKFYEAVSLFEAIGSVDDNDIGMKLLIAECYIQLGRESKAEKAVGAVEKILMTPPMCSIDDVMSLALDFSNNASYIRALLLLRIASDMFYNNFSLSPDDQVEGIFRCLSKMDDVIDEMVKPPDSTEDAQNIFAIQQALAMDGDSSIDVSKIIGSNKKSSGISERTRVLSLDYGVEVMEEMLEKMNSIKDSDPELKTLKLAKAAIFINSQYKEPSQFLKAVKVIKFAIVQLEKQFGRNARQYRIYAETLYIIGGDYHNSEKYKEAEFYATQALEANEYALDFESEEQKRKTIQRTREAIKTIHSHMKSA